MKKIALSLIVGLSMASTAMAQSKLDLPVANELGKMAVEAQAASRSGARLADQSLALIITFVDEAAAAAFEAENSDCVRSRRDELVIAVLTPTQIDDLCKNDAVLQLSMGEVASPKLDSARAITGVDAVQSGDGLDKAYTGAGVLVGLFDTGLDPNHVNFKGGDGTNRIKRLWTITGNTSAVATYDTEDKISRFTTDDRSESHGTHVLGIMTGSYKTRTRGQTEVAYIENNILSIGKNKAVPYYGVAPDAEIAACGGTFESVNISTAGDLVSAYAKERGLPAVFNLSLGHNSGPHDGTTAINKYLSKLGQDMIICMSAGNEGADNLSYEKTFTASDRQFKTFLSRSASVPSATVDVWSSDAEPVTVTLVAVNKNTGATTFSFAVDQNMNGNIRMIGGSNYKGYTNVTVNNSLSQVFGADALVRYNSSVNAANNRYQVYINVELGAGAQGANVYPGIIVEGNAGKTVSAYVTGSTFMSNDMAGFVNGSPDCSISDLACGDNILVVGSYVGRDKLPTLGGLYNVGTIGRISSFSSYGKTFGGKQLPDIAGPGEGIVSSYSYYYVNELGASATSGLSVNHPHDSRASHWAEMSGTSMSSPFVAGVMALWLQADPTLTIGEVKEILKATAKQDEFTAAAPHRFGYGKIDALAGIKHILGTGGVTDVKVDNDILVSEVSRGCFDIFAAGASQVNAALYGLNGAQAAAVSANGDSASLTTDGLAAGVYVLRATAAGKTVTRKVVVR